MDRMTADNGSRFSDSKPLGLGEVFARAKADLRSIANDEGETVTTRRAAMFAAKHIGTVERALDKASLFSLKNRLIQLKGQADAQKAAAK